MRDPPADAGAAEDKTATNIVSAALSAIVVVEIELRMLHL
jgi:hypothetical protein